MSDLQLTWFLLVGVLLTGYAILDGFDLGVGIWYLFARKQDERPALLNAVGPLWDSNEVWLLTGGGALFAAFPHVYATVFSGFYLALMLLLFALIFRAVAFEARNKSESPAWRGAWDYAFALGSALPALLFGVALGNIIRGLPLDEARNYTGDFFGLLNPYALLVGLLGFAMIATHGAVFITLKVEGDLANRAKRWARWSCIAFLCLFLLVDHVTVLNRKELIGNYLSYPILWVIPVIALASIIKTWVFNEIGRASWAFLASCSAIASLMAMVGTAIFPNLVPARNVAEDGSDLSLTIMNSSSSELTLKVMLIVALIGMPLVLLYTTWVYRIFGGKVTVSDEGY